MIGFSLLSFPLPSATDVNILTSEASAKKHVEQFFSSYVS